MYQRAAPSPLDPLRQLGRRLGLGALYNAAWRRPAQALHALALDGGPIERRRTAAGHEAMRAAATRLPALAPPDHDLGAVAHMLTGAAFWHQSVYCIASLQLVADQRITPVFYSDGSLDAGVQNQIRAVLPWATFVAQADIEAQLEAILPPARFPSLRRRRLVYPHLRKLTDIHIFARSWKLVLDSDLLFFRTPDAMLDWFQAPCALYMMDVEDNYGYPLDYLADLAGAQLPDRVNVGVYGLDSSAIDWERVEDWCARQLRDFGPAYVQEQGLTAMLLAQSPARALPEHDYVLRPSLQEGRARGAVMHHYVAYSKRSYFQHAWRVIDERVRAASGLQPPTSTHAPDQAPAERLVK